MEWKKSREVISTRNVNLTTEPQELTLDEEREALRRLNREEVCFLGGPVDIPTNGKTVRVDLLLSWRDKA